MKPKHYVKKYNLSKSPDFNHEEFISDFTLDFISLVEVGQFSQNWNTKMYENIVDQMRDKWEGINNKTLGQLPEKLWNYFYATTVVKAKKELFPEVEELKMEIRQMDDNELTDFIKAGLENLVGRNCYVSISYFGDHVVKKDHKDVIMRDGSEGLRFALREAESRSRRENKKAREEEEKRWKEYIEQRRKKAEEFFKLLIGSINILPVESFKTLGITETSGPQEVKKAFKSMSMKCHPDRGGNKEKFIEITEAKNKCLAYLQEQPVG